MLSYVKHRNKQIADEYFKIIKVDIIFVGDNGLEGRRLLRNQLMANLVCSMWNSLEVQYSPYI
ncbi:hypothetical protein HanPSC8_Chr08g0347761 [Helianthus annuus]|nr:hypothetical protein HanPSC8_Chr08g0347761 [Helianthus annuus]